MNKNISEHSVYEKHPLYSSIITTAASMSNEFTIVDMFAGRGWWELDNRQVDGSPVVAAKVMEKLDTPFNIVGVEKNPLNWLNIKHCMKRFVCKNHFVLGDANKIETFDEFEYHDDGIIFCDPESSRFSWNTVITMAERLPTYHVLIHFSALSRRRPGSIPVLLTNLLDKFDRKKKFIWGVDTSTFGLKLQWTMLLLTNTLKKPDGFVSTNTKEGYRRVMMTDTFKTHQ